MTTADGAEELNTPDGFAQECLSTPQQLAITLQTVDAFAHWVTNVDTKVATLAAGQVALVLFMAAQRLPVAWSGETPMAWATRCALTAFVVAFLATAWHVWAALRPRVSGGPHPNRFAFPSVARMSEIEPIAGPIGLALAEAWQQARVLAVIAIVRYRHLSRALMWTVVSVLSAVVWRISAGFLGS